MVKNSNYHINKSYLHEMIRSELEDIVGSERVTDADVDKDVYSTDIWWIPRMWIDRGLEVPKPDFIIYPKNSEEVSEIVRISNKYKIPIIPRGGGAGDTGGGLSIFGGGIIIDMKRMNKIIKIDEKSLTVKAQTGILQVDLEEQLNDRGYTTNHFPASFYCSTLGGFLALRGSGVLSTKYGKIDTMTLSLKIVLPNGEIINTLPIREHSTGPDLSSLFLGSEGTLGIITEATLKICHLPEERRFKAFLFEALHSALEAGRKIMTTRLRPSVIRVYDEVDTRKWIKSVLGFEKSGSYMIIGFDGFREVVDAEEKLAIKIISGEGGQYLGEEWGKKWWDHRFDFYYPPHTLESTNYLYGVIDTIGSYDKIEKIYWEMKKNIENNYKKWGIEFMGHFSHWYESSAALYPLFIIENPPDDPYEALKLYSNVWDTGVRTALKNGGVVNEHHGVGAKLSRFMRKQYGP
ncbi:MAG: FAD-binding oxidoreductase, partial [Asgard group archaeon]